MAPSGVLTERSLRPVCQNGQERFVSGRYRKEDYIPVTVRSANHPASSVRFSQTGLTTCGSPWEQRGGRLLGSLFQLAHAALEVAHL